MKADPFSVPGKKTICVSMLALLQRVALHGTLCQAGKRPRQHGQNPLAQEGKLLTHSCGSLVTVKEKLLWHCHPTLGHPRCAACSLHGGYIPDPLGPRVVLRVVIIALPFRDVSRTPCHLSQKPSKVRKPTLNFTSSFLKASQQFLNYVVSF